MPLIPDLPRGTAIIVRHRDAALRAQLAKRLLGPCRKHQIRLLVSINKAFQGGGVASLHVPEKHYAGWVVRQHGRRNHFITSSAHSKRALTSNKTHVDLHLVSPLFETPSHPGASPARSMVLTTAPTGAKVAGLGGITSETAPKLITSNLLALAGITFFLKRHPDK